MASGASRFAVDFTSRLLKRFVGAMRTARRPPGDTCIFAREGEILNGSASVGHGGVDPDRSHR